MTHSAKPVVLACKLFPIYKPSNYHRNLYISCQIFQIHVDTVHQHSGFYYFLERQQELFVQGYNLEGDDVIKYTRKHPATGCNCKPGFCMT